MSRKKTIPKAIVWALGIAAVLYTGVALLAVAGVGAEAMAESRSPLEVAARTFEAIVAAAAFTILLYYSIANLAALKMRKEDKLFPDWIPVAGFISCLLLAFTMRPMSFSLAWACLPLVLYGEGSINNCSVKTTRIDGA
jgi:amino acid transporter